MENSKGPNTNSSAKIAAESKQDFDLHTLLIMRVDKLAKSKAIVVAYNEGKAGLAVRLAK